MELLKPPPPLLLAVNNAKEAFLAWKQKFLLYYTASGVEDRTSESQKAALLLHCAGDEAIKIYNTIEGKEKLKYTEILSILEEACSPPINETYNRHLFFSRHMKDGESYEEYITELKKLSMDCNFDTLKDSLVRDQIIMGLTDMSLKERLLRCNNLTLKECIEACKVSQATQARMNAMKGSTSDQLHCDVIKQRSEQQRYQSRPRQMNNHQSACGYCGGSHAKNKCPAYGRKCAGCGKYNHFVKMCRYKGNARDSSPKVHQVGRQDQNSDQESESELFIGAINMNEWYVECLINNEKIQFKVDTGSQANILTQKIVKRLNLNIKKSRDRLKNFDGSDIACLGICYGNIRHNGNNIVTKFHIVEYECACIMGLDTAVKFGLVNNHKVNTVDKNVKSNCYSSLVTKYKDLFRGLGKLDYTYNIKLTDNCIPVAERPRKIPYSVQDKVKHELDRMEQMGVVRKVCEPTEWVSSMVVVCRDNNKVRICLDPQNLNKAIVRERHMMPTFEELISKMPNAKYFSVLDACKGFYQICLSPESQLLTTFNAGHLGRYCYLRLPFGLNSAPEVFSKCFSDIFKDVEGVQMYVDEIIVWGSSLEEHDQRLERVLETAQQAGVKFNKEKCQFGVTEVNYVGHILSSKGLKPDPEKVRAILEMEEPQSKKQLQNILGMITYISKFIPNASDITHSFRDLLKKDSEFVWGDKQKHNYQKLKDFLTSLPVLKYFNHSLPITLSVDSSSTGLGAVLLQENMPVAYASKALTECQTRWAQIEKEMLAIVYACEKFHQYIYGKKITIESDHKPLQHIFQKCINETPLRLQRLRLRLQCYDLDVRYKPGKELLVADALSRSYVHDNICNSELDQRVDLHVCMIINNMNISKSMLNLFQKETEKDKTLSLLKQYIQNGWSQASEIPFELKFYHSIKDELYVHNNLIFKNTALIVPNSLRRQMLQKIHYTHLGVEKCKNRVRGLLFWPFLNKELEDSIGNCATCLQFQKNHSHEPLLLRKTPTRPWQILGADMFFILDKIFLLVVDYLTKYIEIIELKNQSTDEQITAFKALFARWGIPEIVYTDDASQYRSASFVKFCEEWNFLHVSSSPYYQRSNGMAERHIQTFKKMYKKCIRDGRDPYFTLLEYRNTVVDSKLNLSPNEMMLKRQTVSILPTRNIRNVNYKKIVKFVNEKKYQYKYYHDKTNKGKQIKYEVGQNVFVRDRYNKLIPGRVIGKANKPRCYKIKLSHGYVITRNTYHIFKGSKTDCQTEYNYDNILENDSRGSKLDPNSNQQILINNNNCKQQPQTIISKEEPVANQNLNGIDYCQDSGQNNYVTRSGRVINKPIRYQD